MRRLLDIIAAIAGILVLWPVLIVTAILVRIFLGSPVLFQQKRAGLNCEPFTLVKFRTMTDARGPDGELLSDEERTTKFGHFLRRFRLDELPELWNLLRGDMAMFGPRPLLPVTIEEFGADGVTRCSIRPGLTGWAQIRGGPLLTQQDKLALDNWYVANRSWKVDLTILLQTFLVVVRDDRVDDDAVRRAHESASRRRG